MYTVNAAHKFGRNRQKYGDKINLNTQNILLERRLILKSFGAFGKCVDEAC
jgi:hypothetical protein